MVEVEVLQLAAVEVAVVLGVVRSVVDPVEWMLQ